MGVVDLALDPSGRPVALKRLAITGSADELERARARLRREVEALRQVRHPAIVPLLDVIDDGDDLVLVMPYLSGGSLADRVLRDGPLSPRDVARLARQLLPALATMHRRGVVHRDCKPANVLFDADGRALLTDFGVAALRDATGGLTDTGSVVGTPAFIAPEQARGDEPTTAADVFALGATLYFAATGEAVYGDTDGATMLRRAAGNGIRADLSRVDPALARPIAAMLHPDPRQRPSAAQLAGGPQGTQPAAPRPPVAPSAPPLEGPPAGPRHRVGRRRDQIDVASAAAVPATAAQPVVPVAPRAAIAPAMPADPATMDPADRPHPFPTGKVLVGSLVVVALVVAGVLVLRVPRTITPASAESALHDAVGPTTTCLARPYQPCGAKVAPFTDGDACLAGRADYDDNVRNGCEVAADKVDGSALAGRVRANLVPADDTDSYPVDVDDEFSFACDGRFTLTLEAPANAELVLTVLAGDDVVGTATTGTDRDAVVALDEPRCAADDSVSLTARVAYAPGSPHTGDVYQLTRAGNF